MIVIPTYYTNAFFLSSVWKKEGVVLPTPYNAKSTKIKLLWFRTSLNNNQIETELRLEHQTAGCFRNEFFQEAYSIFYARSDFSRGECHLVKLTFMMKSQRIIFTRKMCRLFLVFILFGKGIQKKNQKL